MGTEDFGFFARKIARPKGRRLLRATVRIYSYKNTYIYIKAVTYNTHFILYI